MGQHIHRGTGGAVSRIDTFDTTAAFSTASNAFERQRDKQDAGEVPLSMACESDHVGR